MDELIDEVPGLLRIARDTLTGHAPDTNAGTSGEVVAAVTAYADGKLLASAVGHGPDLPKAVRRGAQRVRDDPRFARATGVGQGSEAVSLWIPSAEVPIEKFEVGRDAVLIDGPDGRTYRPSVPLTRGYADPDTAVRRLAPRGAVRAQTWRHFMPVGEQAEQSGRAIELRRLRPDPPPLTAHHVHTIVDRALDRLLATQQDDGAYRYTDHAFRERPPTRPNLIRLAGTAYAVAKAAEGTTDEVRRRVLTSSAQCAVHHLLAHAVDVGDGMLIRAPDRYGQRSTPAGAAALTLLAMQYGGLTERFRSARAALVNALLALQQRDGRFRSSPDSESAQSEGTQQDYYPGEIMLALIHEAERGDGVCWASISRAFDAHVDYVVGRPRLASALWQADVWWRAWRLVGGAHGGAAAERYAGFVRRIGDHVLRRRLPTTAGDEFRGGFARTGSRPGISSACYVEALVRAFEVSVGDRDARRKYGSAVRAGLRFVARLQVDPALTSMLPRPEAALGGFTPSVQSFDLRSDHDQHAITMFLAAKSHRALLVDGS